MVFRIFRCVPVSLTMKKNNFLQHSITLLFACIFLGSSGKAQSEKLVLQGLTQGTTFRITYIDSEGRDFYEEIENLLARFDQSLSTYVPESIISRINANDPDAKADHYFTTCFNKAKEIWEATDGAFDPTVYPLVNLWGFGPGEKRSVSPELIDSILTFVGFDLVNLVGDRLIKQDKRVALDFNACAQGYAVDVVAEFLQSKGVNSFLVEIGGEVYAHGYDLNEEYWLVGIEKPIENPESGNPLEAIVILENLAVATSGNYRKFVEEDGIKYGHQIDPKTGCPGKNRLLSATIFASDALTADATATGVLVMGLEKGISYLEAHPELQAFLIYSDHEGDYQVYQTPGIHDILLSSEH